MKIGLIVEGHGEVKAAPIVVRRLVEELGIFDVEIPPPYRLPKSKMAKPVELEKALRFMMIRTAPDGVVLLLVDADTDCPAQLGPSLLATAGEILPNRGVGVVVAKSEFEGWFLAAAESLAGKRGLPASLVSPSDPEGVRDAKGWLGERMPRGYSETVDQPALAAIFDLSAATNTDSFAKLRRELTRLVPVSKTRDDAR